MSYHKSDNSIVLKPCPLCGYHAAYREGLIHGEAWGSHFRVLWCSRSHCRVAVQLPHDYPDVDARLARMWNRRAA